MKPELRREQELLHAALELAPAQRAAYLAKACAGDAALRARVEALLAVQSSADALFDPAGQETSAGGTGADATATVRLTAPTEKPGDTIGRYKLLQQIGEGGCGTVYMAEQSEPVRRKVALKVIKLGMDTKSVIARFEAERQALAMMDHPNIAKVLDAGATDTGRPYFVMELVRGIRITDYCDQANLSTQDRLDLFIKVCSAIQHAHQKGIIHRDIKPSNILVTLHDGVPVPKVIDFGIAKATEARLTDLTLFTELHAFVGTPAYMSPEQAEMSGLDMDTRADIYSLGVLLYELLSGKLPFDPETLLKAGLDEMRRTIREVEPPRPSTRLSTMTGGDLTAIAKHRSTEAAKLSTLLRGDLDWIVMKALEKDRTRRYESASAFAQDIKRYLGNEAVLACPPSAAYLLQKLVRRHRLAFAAGAAVAASLVIGLSVSTWLFFKEKKARERAVNAEQEQTRLRTKADEARATETRLRQEAEAAKATEQALRVEAQADKKRAQEEALQNAQVRAFTENLFADVAKALALQEENPLFLEVLDSAAIRLRKELESQPLVAAPLFQRIGETYMTFDKPRQAEALFKEASGILMKLPDRGGTLLVSAFTDHARAVAAQGQFDEAERLQQDAIVVNPKPLPSQRKETVDQGLLLNTLGDYQFAQGRLAAAEASWLAARSVFDSLGPNTIRGGIWLKTLAQVQERLDKLQSAESNWTAWLGELAFEFGRVRSVEQSEFACFLLRHGRLSDATKLLREPLAGLRTADDLIHKAVTNLTSNLDGRLKLLRGAEAILVKFMGDKEFSPEHEPDEIFRVMSSLQRLNHVWNDLSPSADQAAAAANWERRAAEWVDPSTLRNRARTMQEHYRYPDARALLREVVAQDRTSQTNATPRLARSLVDLAHALAMGGKSTESAKLLREALDVLNQCQPPQPSFRAVVLDDVSFVLAGMGARAPEARKSFPELQDRALTDAQRETCIHNLRHIKGGTGQWVLENRKGKSDIPTPNELWGLRGFVGFRPVCPAGGTYTIMPMGQDPRCSLHNQGHNLLKVNAPKAGAK